MIRNLPFLLTWRYYWDLPVTIYSAYLNNLETAIGRWLSLVKDYNDELGESLTLQLNSLPTDSRLRLITAPETYRRINHRPSPPLEEDIVFVTNSLLAERCLLQKEGQLHSAVWTALGDFYFPVGPVNPPSAPAGALFSWTADCSYQAPYIPPHTVIDGLSPLSIFSVAGENYEMTTHSREELIRILNKLTDAINMVQSIHHPTANVISLVTKVITVRKDLTTPEGFSSSSWSHFIGKAAMTNTHLAHVGVLRLANTLVHEAIHSLLYMVELVEPFYNSEGQDFKAISPWTGNVLYLHSYVHACFVWFGLWNFWCLAKHVTTPSACEVEMYILRSSSGFLTDSFMDTMMELRGFINPQLFEAIQFMREAVTSN